LDLATFNASKALLHMQVAAATGKRHKTVASFRLVA
jgi:hypothetical protein